jgi:hypothetical protein
MKIVSYILLYFVEIIIASLLLYQSEYLTLLILAYIHIQSYMLSKRIDYNRKVLRFINVQGNINFLLLRKHLKIDDKELEKQVELMKLEIGDDQFKQLEKEFKDIGLKY